MNWNYFCFKSICLYQVATLSRGCAL
uniref:Uncharacterized protein n=1 Tax=Anguilla anguilla TaxID=7936 RepID=A0A0E9VVC2_ANGAN